MARNMLVKQRFETISHSNSSPFAKLLDWCIKSNSIRHGRCVHAQILKSQFSSEIFIQNRLVDLYGKCGFVDNARKLFDKMPQRNIFTYNSFLSGLTRWGFCNEAIEVFLSIPVRDQCSWNSMVSGFAQHDRFEEAVEYFVGMYREGFTLNQYSFGSVLSACAGLLDLEMGVQVHALMIKSPCLVDVYMGSALVDMYAKCGEVECAQKSFDHMVERNRVTWNSLITCYEQNGPVREAIEVFVKMMDHGFEPDEVTLASVVSACATLKLVREGREIHALVMKRDKFRNDMILSNALVDMYSKCGRIKEAGFIFQNMRSRNVISVTTMVSGYAKAASVETANSLFMKMVDKNIVAWNALMAGYAQNGENEKALSLFQLLKRESVFPSHYTFANLLNACANLADLNFGIQVHVHLLKHGICFCLRPECDIFVGNALIDLYMKCGSVQEALRVFHSMVERDLVSWNAMIVGYAQNGYAVEALEMYKRMRLCGEKPDHITMIGVLSACSHGGLVEEGRHYFHSMVELHGLEPWKDHYTCMVDLLGRAACFEEAKEIIDTMPMTPDYVVWASLLSACKVHKNADMGKYVAERLLEIDPSNSGPYVLLSNIYAELGRWAGVTWVRNLMIQKGVVKQPGCSWIDIQSHVHVFMVKDMSHPLTNEIYLLLRNLTKHMKLAGYVLAPTDSDMEEEEINYEAVYHSLECN
ncbi:pentatricopeptide repeat-containing protein At2g13600 [Amaranthus tricolor]|uniref:pentatricopeptide repeat-containing protein At2g13600 n=1 Tax=Amaranthus tricolor TaxID=29722 RepID=UPI0025906F96|nr:pentatricopeptide repeat-containing protein At2g13600 [Amaranthus tricolor]XP_057544328.1 pentatricopeptide repeat-containing protein At2g13600 [Amaranthus tricolor]XP_057544329.1 pentatricopeptide repeat-containing protein At2g13600 [Amaranthus tricolor]